MQPPTFWGFQASDLPKEMPRPPYHYLVQLEGSSGRGIWEGHVSLWEMARVEESPER